MDISNGISSAENNIRQSFFVFLRMVITNNIIGNRNNNNFFKEYFHQHR